VIAAHAGSSEPLCACPAAATNHAAIHAARAACAHMLPSRLADWMHPQPWWSAFRESSYGHGEFDLVNATHAHWVWHRNDDGTAQVRGAALICSAAPHVSGMDARMLQPVSWGLPSRRFWCVSPNASRPTRGMQVADDFWLVRDTERCPPRQLRLGEAGDDNDDEEDDDLDVLDLDAPTVAPAAATQPATAQPAALVLGRKAAPGQGSAGSESFAYAIAAQ